jgi:NAD(P)-dependent dehydrogenase (short-subunit alcohol dehydrogenase family)
MDEPVDTGNSSQVTATAPIPTRQRPLELYGRVAIVTGAAKGIGRTVSELFAREGARIVLAGRDDDALRSAVAELTTSESSCSAVAQVCDVTKPDDTERLVARALDEWGQVDILVDTAGGTGAIETPAHEYPAEEFRKILELNVLGTFLPCKAVIPTMIKRRQGRIINVAGTSGLRGYRNRSGYSASKWAVRGLTRTLALELGPFGITVNDVCPNVTNGARMDKIIRTKAEKLGKTIDQISGDFASETALGRFVDQIDVAEAILFLASDRARSITGQDIVVDAGWSV